MISNLTKPMFGPTRLASIGLATLALLIAAAPAFATGANPQTNNADSKDQPDATCPAGGQCFADVIQGSTFYDYVNRIYQQDIVAGYQCGGQGEPCDGQNRPYYRSDNLVNRGQMAKFVDNARRLPGIDIEGAFGSVNPIYLRNDNGADLEARTNNGVAIHAISNSNTGVYGIGGLLGVAGDSANGYGVSGNGTNNGIGVYGWSRNGIGVKGASDNNEGVHGETASNHPGVYGINTNASSNQAPGVRGDGRAGPGVYGYSTGYYGVFGQSQTSLYAGVYGNNSALFGYGVQGVSSTGYGVDGESTSNAGVRGLGTTGVVGQGPVGVDGLGSSIGVRGTTATGYGVYGEATTIGGGGYAGYFNGNVTVTGTCTGCLGPDRIDDPLDPTGKYLNQTPVESSDMMDIYNGNVTTDASGEAIVQMPDWFEALNRDFRYQLTVVGQFAQAIVWKKMENNRFSIKTDKPSVEVSWQVTGIRQDPYANAHRVPVEQAKPAGEQGKYLHPAEYGQPASMGTGAQGQQATQNSPKP